MITPLYMVNISMQVCTSEQPVPYDGLTVYQQRATSQWSLRRSHRTYSQFGSLCGHDNFSRPRGELSLGRSVNKQSARSRLQIAMQLGGIGSVATLHMGIQIFHAAEDVTQMGTHRAKQAHGLQYRG